MPVVRKFGFGRITSVTKADGTPYDKSEFRTAYVDVPGLVLFYESFKKFPGKYFLYLYPYCEGHTQTYFHSSCGDLAVDGHRYTLRTANSVYTAQDDPLCLSADAKMDLLLNTRTISMEEGLQEISEQHENQGRGLYSVYLSRMTRGVPEHLRSLILDPDRDTDAISVEIDRCLEQKLISPDQARCLNNKYVNFERTGRTYYV